MTLPLDFLTCKNQPQQCVDPSNPPVLEQQVTTVNSEPDTSSPPGQCFFKGRSVDSGSVINFDLASYRPDGSLFRTARPCASSVVSLADDFEDFTHFWLNDISAFVLDPPFQSRLSPTDLDVKQVRDDEACGGGWACVSNPAFAPVLMQLEAGALNAYTLRTIAHEMGHVMGHAAGVMGFNVLNDHHNRSGREGFADGISLAYALERQRLSPRSFDELQLSVEEQIMPRLHAGFQEATLFGLHYPVPAVDQPTVGNLGQVGRGRPCSRLSKYDCGAVLARVFWYAYWNVLPSASRHLSLPSGSDIVTSISDEDTRRGNALEALAAAGLDGNVEIEDELDRFHDAMFDLTPVSDHVRLAELFRQLCIDENGRVPVDCLPLRTYPGVPMPVGSVVERSFSDGPVRGFSWSAAAPGVFLDRSTGPVNREEFVSGGEMQPAGGGLKQIVVTDKGVDLTRLVLPPGGSATFTIDLPTVSVTTPGATTPYPLQLLTGVDHCAAPGLLIAFRNASGLQAHLSAPHPVNARVACGGGTGGGVSAAVEFRGPDAHNLIAMLEPGTYEVTLTRTGAQGDLYVYGAVFRTQCPGAFVDSNGDGVSDTCDPNFCFAAGDPDLDNICDTEDNCLCPSGGCSTTVDFQRARNPGQRDRDGDGLGDTCDPCVASADHVNPNDGVADDDFSVWVDTDGDGVCDGFDNCTTAPNVSQSDRDADGIGDACDSDVDGDGLLNATDSCPRHTAPVYGQPHQDADGDGIGDECDCTGGSGPLLAPSHMIDFDNCGDARAVATFEAAQRALAHLGDVFDSWGLEGPILDVGPSLQGCLRHPCDLSSDPALRAAAEDFAHPSLELGYFTRQDLVAFALEQTADLAYEEAERLADWLIDTSGDGLVRP